MDVSAVLQDLFGRVDELVPEVLEGLDEETLARRPDGVGNPIGWLVWHLTRVEDDHVARALGLTQLWDEGWRERFALDLDPHAIGYGAGDAEVAAVRTTADLLRGYHEAVGARTREVAAGLDAAALDRVVDERWTPPVTLGVRLLSVASDCLQHLGQAAYVRGLIARSS
ncbi:mycothiol transferase [Jatrophihabitans sp. YIM 134969]